MSSDLTALEMLASLALLVPVVVFSLWAGLHLERSIVLSSIRAALQLLAVGVVFRLILETDGARWLVSVWIGGMVVVAEVIIQRRVPDMPGLRWRGIAAIGTATFTSVLVIVGLGVLPFEPVTLLVASGLSIGNTLPSAVQAAILTRSYFRDRIGEVEALLSLGLSTSQVKRIAISQVSQVAMIQQIERTRIVGLLAIPGTMTGLLLAGVSPIQAVLMQIIVVYLVLGSTALGVIVITVAGANSAFTSDARPARWARNLE